MLTLPECGQYATKPVPGCETRTGTGNRAGPKSSDRPRSSSDSFLDYLLR